jgi:hypothetical protein
VRTICTIWRGITIKREPLMCTRGTRRNIPEDTILHSHHRGNLKSYIVNFLFHFKRIFSTHYTYEPDNRNLPDCLLYFQNWRDSILIIHNSITHMNTAYLVCRYSKRYFFKEECRLLGYKNPVLISQKV